MPANQSTPSKVLLMGPAFAGKTSMKSIIFANTLARETRRLHSTIDIEHSSLRFLGNMRLNLWDCGGQDTFMENYFESQRETIFQNAEVLIYVMPSDSKPGSSEISKDLRYFRDAHQSLIQYSPNARTFCLIHKMDLIRESLREEVFETFQKMFKEEIPAADITCYGTSIWDETLFKAWSNIVREIVPGVDQLEKQLKHICKACEADEVVLFEKNTFLVLQTGTLRDFADKHRYEKISNIVKQFKLSCNKVRTNFRSFQVRSSKFFATIEPFLQHSMIMVITSNDRIQPAATSTNLWAARTYFAELAREGVDFGTHL